MTAHGESVHPRPLRVVPDGGYPNWEAVYQENATWVYRTIFARVGNRADAEDVTAEVFLAALRPLRLTASVGEVRAYLRATARTVLAAHWRETLGRTRDQFDQVKQMMTGLRTPHVFTVPGEHDSVDDAGQKYRSAFGAGTRGDGWYSLDIAGVHVIALVNTLNLKKLGHLGVDQLEFVAKDVASLPSDTPIIVFSHIPLFAMYPDWGWGTDDAAQALSYLRRFSSVTCLNGHVHQVFSKTEGNVMFYSGTTTAYPFPHPGDGPAPKPVTLPAGKLHDALGIREVSYTRGRNTLALKEGALQ